jgi:hypothetical protein
MAYAYEGIDMEIMLRCSIEPDCTYHILGQRARKESLRALLHSLRTKRLLNESVHFTV